MDHIVFCRSGTTGSIFNNMSLYINGTLVCQQTFHLVTHQVKHLLGYATGLNLRWVTYHISGWRWMNGYLAFDATQSTITVPSTNRYSTTNDANTSFTLNFTKRCIYDSTGKGDLIITGDARISTGGFQILSLVQVV